MPPTAATADTQPAVNPFEDNEAPPAYGAHYNDTYVAPEDTDWVLQQNRLRTSDVT